MDGAVIRKLSCFSLRGYSALDSKRTALMRVVVMDMEMGVVRRKN